MGGERRCCTPQNPCGLGEGDCDGQLDGGKHDGNAGCRAGLVCGSNNCRKFGLYYHEKDDCCDYPSGGYNQVGGGYDENWSQWSSFGPCYNGKKTRSRSCYGSSCTRTKQTQDRNCYTSDKYGYGSNGYGNGFSSGSGYSSGRRNRYGSGSRYGYGRSG